LIKSLPRHRQKTIPVENREIFPASSESLVSASIAYCSLVTTWCAARQAAAAFADWFSMSSTPVMGAVADRPEGTRFAAKNLLVAADHAETCETRERIAFRDAYFQQ
jgi:hypothetical protein